MKTEKLDGIMTFVKANFLKIMGVFLVIGLLQYECSKSTDEVVMEGTPGPPTITERVDVTKE